MTSSAGEGSQASATSRKGKEKRIADSPPSDEPPAKWAAIAPRGGHNTNLAAELYSLPGGHLRLSELCDEITEDQELKILAEKYRNIQAKHVDIASRVGGGVTTTHIKTIVELKATSLKGRNRVEPRRRHCPEPELEDILSRHKHGGNMEIIARVVCRTIEDITCLLMKVHLERGLGPMQDKSNTMKT